MGIDKRSKALDSMMHSDIKEKYRQICKNISLNIPDHCTWQWDEKFHTTVVVFETLDQDLILFPIIQEFEDRWDFLSIERSGKAFYRFFIDRFGVIPGQFVFTAGDDDTCKLFAVWWPWGDDEKVSLRVGLFINKADASSHDRLRAMLTQWFKM